MTDLDRHRRLTELFHGARQVYGDARRIFLDHACGDDTELRSEVEKLLAADLSDFLSEPALDESISPPTNPIRTSAEPAIPDRIGPYLTSRRIGEGGMGIVFVARRDGATEDVALKVARFAALSAQALRRFEYESHLLSRMQHPAIARLLDVGTVESVGGVRLHYFAMELIRNALSITEYARRVGLDVEARLRLVTRVLDGLHHGHQRGVIHRDLKPSNILVDSDGNPKIIDFGIARTAFAEGELSTMHTRTGDVLGTPQYMSPEQLEGSRDIDVRTDCYSVGVVLFELLTGELPIRLDGSTLPEVLRQVREATPRRLSEVEPKCSRALEIIVDTALAFDRERRYASAAAFADDVRHHLRGEAISARTPGVAYQLRVFARRHRAVIVSAAVIGSMLVAATIVSLIFAFDARRRSEEVSRKAYRATLAAAGEALVSGDVAGAQSHLAEADESRRGWEWRYFQNRIHPEKRRYALSSRRGKPLAFSPDGTRLAIGDAGQLVVLDLGNDETRRSIELSADELVERIWFSGERLLVSMIRGVSPGIQRRLLTVEPEPLAVSASMELGSAGMANGLELSADQQRLVFLTRDALNVLDLNVRDLKSSEVIASRERRTEIHGLSPPALAPDGSRVVVLSRDYRVFALALPDLRHADDLFKAPYLMNDMTFDHSGSWLAAASLDGTVQLHGFGAHSGERFELNGHASAVVRLAFSPNDRLLASASEDRTARVWDVEQRVTRLTLRGHESYVGHLAFSPDGQFLATAGDDPIVIVWDLGMLEDPTELRGHASYVNPMVLIDGGRTLVTGGWDGLVGEPGALRLWDLGSGEPVGAWQARAVVTQLAASSDERWIAAGSDAGLLIIDARTGRVVRRVDGADSRSSMVFDSRGELIHFTTDHHLVRARVETGGSSSRVPSDPFARMEFSPSGRSIFLGREGLVREIDSESFELLAEYPGFDAITSSPDERLRILVNEHGFTVLAHGANKVLAERTLVGCRGVRFLTEEHRLLAFTRTGRIHLYETEHWEPVGQLTAHDSYIFDLLPTRDGHGIISTSGDGTARIWEARPLADRLADRRSWRQRAESIRPVVSARFDSGASPEDVLRWIETSDAFSDPEDRHVAHLIARSESMERDPSPLLDH